MRRIYCCEGSADNEVHVTARFSKHRASLKQYFSPGVLITYLGNAAFIFVARPSLAFDEHRSELCYSQITNTKSLVRFCSPCSEKTTIYKNCTLIFWCCSLLVSHCATKLQRCSNFEKKTVNVLSLDSGLSVAGGCRGTVSKLLASLLSQQSATPRSQIF